jgi:uncharacterized membrane protein YoaK (UPF0700 family)
MSKHVHLTDEEQEMEAADKRLDMSQRLTEVEEKLETLIRDLSGIIKFSQRVEGGLALGQGVGSFAMWFSKISIAFTIVWAIFKYVILEAGKK